jgi:nucleotide-binding universal stress UspA family protein
MSFKTILVHVDASRHLDVRMEIAANIAAAENAHLIGAAMSGVSKFLYETVTTNPDDPAILPYLEMLRGRAADTLGKFEEIARKIGVSSYESRLADDAVADGLSVQARYCDLAVLGQYDAGDSSPAANSSLPEYVAIQSGCPVLVVPYASPLKTVGERVLVAWNASTEARRAVRNAIPLLKRAKVVDVAVFNPASQPGAHGAEPGADIALYLSRHGVKVNVVQKEVEGDIGQALLSLAGDLRSDLLVMGCYGHSRFREVLLGGATRTILKSSTIPVLMSH